MAIAPARMIGLPAGRLAAGTPADLVLCDINAPVVIDADKLLSKSKNSPFDGRSLQGRVLLTLVPESAQENSHQVARRFGIAWQTLRLTRRMLGRHATPP